MKDIKNFITLCVPYYNDPHRLREFLLNDYLCIFDEVIIVDDASPDYPALPIIEDMRGECPWLDFDRFHLYRVQEDYGFNAHGARNLAASESNCEWLFFVDVDMILDKKFLEGFFLQLFNTEDEQTLVCNVHGGDPSNIFAARKENFFLAGGYDEELRGYHMGDKLFRERLDLLAEPIMVEPELQCNRRGRKVVEDDNILGTLYPDDKTVIQRSMKHIQDTLDMIKERNKSIMDWNFIPIVQFDWKKEI
jgi:glycosyltransferase involved in cell wall biosynthesis